MNKKQLGEDNFLIVQKHIKRQENELTKNNNHISLIDQNKQSTFNSNVYVKFIPLETTHDEIKDTFAKCGKIISIKLGKREQVIDGNKVPQYQYAYVLFDKVEEAQKAIREFDSSPVFSKRPLKVELWISKEEIKQQREQQEEKNIKQFFKELMNSAQQQNQPVGGVPGQPVGQDQ